MALFFGPGKSYIWSVPTDLPEWIAELRAEHYKQLAAEYELSLEEVKQVHECELGKLRAIQPRFQQYIGFVLPQALQRYKQSKN